MKKSLIALPLVASVAAAAVAGTSHYAGSQTQNEYQQMLEQLNKLLPLVFVNEQYESGLGNSSAVTKVLASRDADAQVLFRLQHDIKHAAVRMGDDGMAIGTVSINTTLQDAANLDPAFLAALTDDVPFTLLTDVRMSGEVRNQLSVSGLQLQEDGTSGSWSGIDFESVTKDNSTIGSGSMGVLEFNDMATGALVNVEQSPFEFDVKDHGDMIYTGTGEFAFEKVSLVNPQMPVPIAIDSVQFFSDTSMNNDVMSSTSTFSIDGIESPLPIKQASLEVQVNDLMVEGLRRYNNLIFAAGGDPQAIAADPEFMKKMGAAVRDMVKPGSGMKYTIALANDEGDVDANLRIGVKPEAEEGMSADALNNIVTGRDLLNILSVEGALDADTAALAQTPVMMMLGAAGDFITVTDESIKSEVSLNGTTLVVNGTELPLEMMAGGMLDVPFSDLMPQ